MLRTPAPCHASFQAPSPSLLSPWTTTILNPGYGTWDQLGGLVNGQATVKFTFGTSLTCGGSGFEKSYGTAMAVVNVVSTPVQVSVAGMGRVEMTGQGCPDCDRLTVFVDGIEIARALPGDQNPELRCGWFNVADAVVDTFPLPPLSVGLHAIRVVVDDSLSGVGNGIYNDGSSMFYEVTFTFA